MNAELNRHIDQLRHLTTAQLQLQYRELFGQPSHSNHKDYLFRRVAWRLQALAEGGLSERARQYAGEIATDADLRLCAPKKAIGTQPAIRVASASRQLDPRVPPPGTQLIKRYKDGDPHGDGPGARLSMRGACLQIPQRHRAPSDRNAVERVCVFWPVFASGAEPCRVAIKLPLRPGSYGAPSMPENRPKRVLHYRSTR